MGMGDDAATAELATEAAASDEAANVRKTKKRRRDRVRLQEGSRIREPGATDPETEPFTDGSARAGKQEASSITMLGFSSAFDLVRKVSDKMSAKKQGKK